MNVDFKNITCVYFLGIGGIGMSALARYFNHLGVKVCGYDKTPSVITNDLEAEGIDVHFEDDTSQIPSICTPQNTLVVFTPAIPQDLTEYKYLQDEGFKILKRAQVLGLVTKNLKAVAVAGTHGKTSVSTMCGHIMHHSVIDCSAFLGGIANNYNSNVLLPNKESDWVVVEADEFDRSFLQLQPFIAGITSIDADHLDIYGTHDEIKKAFHQFIGCVNQKGTVIHKLGLPIVVEENINLRYKTYSLTDKADYYTQNLTINANGFSFDLVTPNGIIDDLYLPYPGKINVENSVLASALSLEAGVKPDELRKALACYKGVKRRFDLHFKSDKFVLIDDYAHHPEELKATITSVKEMYEGRRITGVFQPHLFSRTKDFHSEFADSLSLLDDLILLDIYPAREAPIEGVTSEIILDKVNLESKKLISKEKLSSEIENGDWDVILMMGAGDIDRLVLPVKEILLKKENA